MAGLFGKTTIAGIELEDRLVKIALVENGLGRSRPIKLISAEIPEVPEPAAPSEKASEEDQEVEPIITWEDAAAETLRGLIKDHGLNPDAYAVAIPSRHAFVRTLTMPLTGETKIRRALRYEIEPYVPLPAEELIVDFRIIGEQNGETRLVAVGARRDVFDRYLGALKMAGISPEVIDVGFAPLSNLYASENPKEEGVAAVVHVVDGNPMVVLMEKRHILLARTLPVPIEEIKKGSDEFCSELANTMRALYSEGSGGNVERIVFTGIRLGEDVRAEIARKLEIEVRELGLAENLEAAVVNGQSEDSSFWYVPIGLATRGIGRSPVGFNFRIPGNLRDVLRTSLSRCAVGTGILLAILLIGGVYHFINRANLLEERRGQLIAEMAIVYEETLGKKPPSRQQAQIPKMFASETEGKQVDFEAINSYLGGSQPVLEILRTIIDGAPSEEGFRLDSIRVDSRRVDIKGTSQDPQAISTFRRDITQSEIFAGEPSLSQKSGEEGTDFTINATRADFQPPTVARGRTSQ